MSKNTCLNFFVKPWLFQQPPETKLFISVASVRGQNLACNVSFNMSYSLVLWNKIWQIFNPMRLELLKTHHCVLLEKLYFKRGNLTNSNVHSKVVNIYSVKVCLGLHHVDWNLDNVVSFTVMSRVHFIYLYCSKTCWYIPSFVISFWSTLLHTKIILQICRNKRLAVSVLTNSDWLFWSLSLKEIQISKVNNSPWVDLSHKLWAKKVKVQWKKLEEFYLFSFNVTSSITTIVDLRIRLRSWEV